jgi:hypothetical protein
MRLLCLISAFFADRHRFLPQSSSSRFTAGAAKFFILSQSGERPDAPLAVVKSAFL